MQQLNNTMLVLPRYWWDTSSGTRLSSSNARVLHAHAQTVDFENTPTVFNEFERMMISRMCPELPPGMCTPPDGAQALPVNRTTFSEMKGFLSAVISVVQAKLSGESIHVTQVEADKRGLVCSRCPRNMMGLCITCNGLKAMTYPYLLWRKTAFDSGLGVCSVCGCMLNAKIWLPKDILQKLHDSEKHKYPDNCWQNKELTP